MIADCVQNAEGSTSNNLMGLLGLLQEKFYLCVFIKGSYLISLVLRSNSENKEPTL
jgi:hypothetical protein